MGFELYSSTVMVTFEWEEPRRAITPLPGVMGRSAGGNRINAPRSGHHSTPARPKSAPERELERMMSDGERERFDRFLVFFLFL